MHLFVIAFLALFVPETKQDLWQLQPIKHVYKAEINGRLLKVHRWLSFVLWLGGAQNVNEKVDLKHSGSAVQGRHRRMKNAWTSVCTSNSTHRNSSPIPTAQQARISITLAIWVVLSECWAALVRHGATNACDGHFELHTQQSPQENIALIDAEVFSPKNMFINICDSRRRSKNLSVGSFCLHEMSDTISLLHN